MKKNKHLILIVILILFLSFTTVSCKKKNNDITKTEQYKIYTLAKDSGYPGTYEEWLETIKGIDGTSIEKVEINTLGELIITLSTGEVINLGRVKGTDGLGIKNVEINDSGELIVTFTDDTTKNLGRILGTSGTNGVGVKSMVVNDYGELILTYTDDVVINLGKIAGKNGIDGIGIKDVTINDEGELLISLTDGTIKNLGVIKERPKEDEVYTVKFVSFDEEIKEIKVKEGCFLETPTINEVEGYRLLGWYLGEDKWRFNIDTVKKDITLIAKWEKIVEEITPVYQGMSIEQASDVKEKIRRVNDVNNSVGIKDAIDDFLDVITTERVEYYAKKGEKFNIVVHLYNPTEYEILSFTLNERKYQSYEFKEGSNSTELIIEVDAGMKPGLKEYTIDAIKYVDKTEIKDVRMDGKRTVKVGIKYDVLPTATIIEEAITSTSYSSIIELKDDNNLMNTQNGMYFFLYDGTNIVYNTLLQVGLNNISYDNLQMGSNYEYMIIGIYDDFSGKGKQAVNLGSKKFASLDGFIVEDATCTKNSISLSIKEESNKATINEINLLIGEEIVRTINNIDNVVFENLLTNTNYTVQVVYSYEFEGATRKNTYTLEYKTLENNRPTFEIESLTSDKYSISYKVTSSDIDNVVTKKQFNLYLNDLLIKKSENEEDVFNELLSNNNYTLEVAYFYDLLDGKNEQTVTVKRNIKTVALEVPKVDVVTYALDVSIIISQVVTDNDNIIKISKPRVLNYYRAEIEMDENYRCIINSINSNTTYQIELTYAYDLNDGNGEIQVTKTIEVTTLKKVPTLTIDIKNVESSSALLTINTTDVNQTGGIKDIFLYKDSTLVKNLSLTDYNITDLTSNTVYRVVVIYGYDLDDGVGPKEISQEIYFKTLKETPDISLKLDPTKSAIKVTPIIKDIDNAGSIEKISLYKDNDFVESQTEGFYFSGLLSNTNYTVKLYYTYDVNNGTDEMVVTLDTKTLPKVVPSVDLSLSSTKDSISYNISYTDIEKTLKIDEVAIYKGIVKVDTAILNSTFDNLFSNTTYEVRITYSYDLNEGNGRTTRTISKTIKTLSKSTPVVGIKLESVTEKEIKGRVNLFDPDNTFSIIDIKLYQNNNLLETTLDSLEFSYSVTSNIEYTIVVEYKYDSDDGVGNQYETFEYKITSGKQVPSLSLSINNLTDNSALLNINVIDLNQTGSLKEITLYKGTTIIKNLSLTDFNMPDLTSNTEYKVVVVYGYDLDDGTGTKELVEEITFKTLKITPDVSLKPFPTKTEIKVNPIIKDIDEAGMIRCVELYKNNTLVDTKTEDFNFTNLLSNTTYTIKLYYTYDLNNGQDEMVITMDVQTLSKIVPTVDLGLSSTKNSINYEVTYTDIENTLKIESIKLFKDNVEILSSDVLNSVFSNLYSNTTYEIRVTYSYDLNEGNGRTTSIISKTIKTLNKSLPIIGIKIDNVTDKEIKGKVNVSDPDSVFNIIDIKLYQNDNLLETTLDSLEFNYNVSSNIEYTIVVEYYYDLDDGMGVQNKTYEYVIRSTKQVPTMIFTPYYVSKDSLEYNLLISDNNVTGRINLISLYEGLTFVRKLSESETKLENLKSNTNYTIRINYVYDFDDGYGSRELNEEYKFKTLKEDPTYELSFNNITKDGFSINHSINDIDGALSFKQVDILLNNVVVKTITSLNDVSFSKLLSNNRYLVVVRFIKDLNNGEEEVSYQEYVRTLAMEKPSIDITLDSTKTTINYSYKITDSDNISTLKDIKLYYNNKEVEGTDNLYTNLLSNNTYKLVITLLNDYHDGRDIQEETYTKEIKTKALEDIELDIKLEALKKEINYKHTLVDVDGISKIVEIKLYLGNKLIKATKDLTEKEFTDLFSNTTYRVVYVVEKDFNDGLGVQTFEYEEVTKTLALMVPVISMSFTSNAESINYKLITVDNDQIINQVKLDVYNGDILVKTITEFDENIINELESNTLYTFRLSYTYNLNENSDDLTTTIDYVYSTLAYNISISKLEVLNETSPKTNEDVNIKFYLDNKSNIKVSYLIINSEKYNILGGDSLNNVIIIMKAPQMSGQMNVKVERMGYVINGVTVEQEVEGLNNLNIEIFSRLDIIDISLVNGTNFDKSTDSLEKIIKIDNPKSYIISEISYYKIRNENNYPYYSDLINNNCQMVDNNHLFIKEDLYGWYAMEIVQIKYFDEHGNECVRKYTSNYKISFRGFSVDQNTFSLTINQISTPEEFINMSVDNIYELMNDIDMTGYSWNPYVFRGYFDGKGHTISNLTYIHEDKWEINYNNQYDLITNILALNDATIKNIYFKDLYVDVDTTSIDSSNHEFKIFDKDKTSTIENVLISGYLNYKYDGKDLSGVFNYEGYIVDHLYFNNKKIENDMIITNELFNSKDFRENTLGWIFKEKEVKEYDGFIYSIIDNSYIIINGYKGENENLVIPSVIDGLPVISIDDLAFINNKTIKSVEFADSLLSIGGSILSGCSNLESLTIGNVDMYNYNYGKYLFGRNYYDNSYSAYDSYVPNNFTTLIINGSGSISYYSFLDFKSLTQIIISDEIEQIGSYVFSGTSISSIFIPYSVKLIDTNAFAECINLCDVTLSNGIKVIRASAFSGCTNLKKIILPKGIEYIESWVFAYDVTIYAEDESYPSRWSSDWNCHGTVIWGYVGTLTQDGITYLIKTDHAEVTSIEGTDVTIPETVVYNGISYNVTTISNLGSPKDLASIILPKGIEKINDYAFKDCIALKEVKLPNTLKYIGSNAFCGCDALEKIILHNGIKTIKNYAFSYCDNLNEVYLPKGIETIGNNVFDSTALIFVEEESCPSGWDSNWNSGAYDKVTWGYVGTLTQDGVTYIITTSHAEVTSIEGVDVRIPEKVLYDGKEYPVTTIKANSITSHIDSLYIPKIVEILEPQKDELSRVGRFYFGVDNKLESWSEYIREDQAFKGQFEFGVKGFVETENIDYFIQGNSAVIYKIKVDDPSIPTSIKFNGTSYNVTSIYDLGSPEILTKITIPEGITSIGFYAFSGCTNLREVNLPNSLYEICEGAFSSSGITSINIPGSVNTIWDNAFASCNNLTSVTLNKGITSIMEGAFSGCTNLTSIILPTGITYMGFWVFDSNLTIYAEDESCPAGWNNEWNSQGTVIWGYKKEE